MFLSKVLEIVNQLFPSHQSKIERYLAESENLVDLENRQRELARKGIWI